MLTAEAFEREVELRLAAGQGYLVTERENIYHHETLREAAVRFQGLRDRGLAPALTSCKTAKLLDWGLVRAYCPWRAIDATGRVIADSEDGLRPEDRTKIGHVVMTTIERCRDKETRREAFPLGEPPKFVNGWTGEELTYQQGISLACRVLPIDRGQG